MKEMVFYQSVYDEIINTVGSLESESGGILLGSREDYIVQKFFFDKSGSRTSGSYDPDLSSLNKIVKREWEENDLELLGFIHSHPRGYSKLSGDWGGGTGDIGYLKAIFAAMPTLETFLVPIMYSSYDGQEREFFPYVATRGREEKYKKHKLVIVDDDKKKNNTDNRGRISTERLLGSIDLDHMHDSLVSIVGIGGANGIAEDLVRSGLGKISLIDFDVVDESNLATQGYYINDIGRLKIDALSERLLNINPDLEVTKSSRSFLDLNENELLELIGDSKIILMMTDDFYAQRRGNLISLKYKIPTVFAMMYPEAVGAEVTFNIPGVTPACHRCATSPRYDAYKNGYKNEVTSQGSNSFQTSYLNSVIGIITLAILHRDKKDTKLSNWFGSKWKKNLIQFRLHPDYPSQLFNNPRGFCLDSVWQEIEHEAPPKYDSCPDCGGHGDLLKTKIDYPV